MPACVIGYSSFRGSPVSTTLQHRSNSPSALVIGFTSDIMRPSNCDRDLPVIFSPLALEYVNRKSTILPDVSLTDSKVKNASRQISHAA